MKLQRHVFFGMTIILSCLAYVQTNEFVKPKREKKKSAARLKDEIGTQLAESLLASTEIVEQVGRLQRELMRMTAALIEQSSESSLTKADRPALTERLHALQSTRRELEVLVQRCTHHTDVIKKQY